VDGDGFALSDGDCDDDDGWRNPDAIETCDGVDNNCDLEIDEGLDCDASGGLEKPQGGCGCASGGGSGAPWWLLGVAVLAGRRRSAVTSVL
ncbi:MAG: hypothetical protein GWP91_01440, partial [Rhodobacterales bacterium]|nr:hypothetical protein [Rhodobacterales bacterium]